MSRIVSGRFTAWLVLVAFLIFSGGILGAASTSESGEVAPNSLPASAESAEVKELQRKYARSDSVPAIVVIESSGAQIETATLGKVSTLSEKLSVLADGSIPPPIPSEDGKAVLLSVPVADNLLGTEQGRDKIAAMRSAVDDAGFDSATVYVTGGPAFSTDIASAFAGADFRLLAVTASVVALLLLITYRSPILWLVPLITVALADAVAGVLAGRTTGLVDANFDSSTAGITSVLVFGAGTNYALLMVSRYREELRLTRDHRLALQRAYVASVPAILSSNLTVVLALATLVFAVLPTNRGLGIAAATGLLIAVVYALVFLPTALAVSGRGLFWPFVPREGDPNPAANGAWEKVASFVTARPVSVLIASFSVLIALGTGVFATSVGLSTVDQFRNQSDSADGAKAVARHFPAGTTNPLVIASRSRYADLVEQAAINSPGVEQVQGGEDSGTGWSFLRATISGAPSTGQSYEQIRDLRARVHSVAGAEAVVGGSVAEELDVRDGTVRDLKLLVPLILAVVFIVIAVVLRAIVGPLLLLLSTIVSALAAIGLGSLASTYVFGFPALAVSVPLFSFLFLVALGIDYTIFLTIRAREETPEFGTRNAIVRAVSLTGGVITSAGIVLAAVFVVLGVLPLITLTQIGIIVGLGIILDTFLVRTVVVPALFAVVGDRLWWPSSFPANRASE